MNTCRICRSLTTQDTYCPSCGYLTIRDAYQMLKVSRPTYYRLVSAGKLNPRQITPGRVLVARSEVETILGLGLNST